MAVSLERRKVDGAWSTVEAATASGDDVANLLALYGVTAEWDDTEANIFGQNVRLGDLIVNADGNAVGYSVRDMRAQSSYDVIAPATMVAVLEWFVANGQYSVGASPDADGLWRITASDIAAIKAEIPELHDGNGVGVPGLPAWAAAVLP